ncbi:MAG: hypothetical protein M3X11_13520 [Acidobacteriota bacterium]|nr:hypothetical protein [Acidobacteriota bacterium]
MRDEDKFEGDAAPTTQQDEEARIGSLAYALKKHRDYVERETGRQKRLNALPRELCLIWSSTLSGELSYADETNSWLAPANDNAFAAAVQSVFADASVRKDKLARSRWTAAQYRWEEVTTRFFALYDELHADFPASRFARQLISKPVSKPTTKTAHEEL